MMFNPAFGCLVLHQVYCQASFEHALDMKDILSLFQGHQQLTSHIQTAKEE